MRMRKILMLSVTALLILLLCSCKVVTPPVNHAPKVTLTSPENGATLESTPVTFTWSATDTEGDALKFFVYISKYKAQVEAMNEKALKLGNSTKTEFSCSDLEPDVDYYWMVAAVDTKENIGKSKVWSFKILTGGIAGFITPSQPKDGATGVDISPVLVWNVDDDEAYEFSVYLSTDASLVENESNESLLGTTTSHSYPVHNLKYNTKYYWRVVAKDGAGKEYKSAVWDFTTVQNYPPSLSYISPEDKATIENPYEVTLKWEASDPEGDTIYYDLYFSTEKSLVEGKDEDARLLTNSTNTKYTVQDLEYSKTYYWKVVAKDSYGNVTEGSVTSFTTTAKPVESDVDTLLMLSKDGIVMVDASNPNQLKYISSYAFVDDSSQKSFVKYNDYLYVFAETYVYILKINGNTIKEVTHSKRSEDSDKKYVVHNAKLGENNEIIVAEDEKDGFDTIPTVGICKIDDDPESFEYSSFTLSKSYGAEEAFDAFKVENYIYLATDKGLFVRSTDLFGEFESFDSGSSKGIYYDRGYLYATVYYDNDSGSYINEIRVFDLSDPSSPSLVDKLVLNNQPLEILKVKDNVMYIKSDSKVAAIDISTPGSPTVISENYLKVSSRDIVPSGDVAFSIKIAGNEVVAYDVSDKDNPQNLSSVPIGGSYKAFREIKYKDGYVYAISQTYGAADSTAKSWLYVFDVNSPENPKIVGWYKAEDYKLSDFDFYGDNYLITSDQNDYYLLVFDISDPENIKIVGKCENCAKYRLTIYDHYVYVDGKDGLNIIDISDPTSPRLLKTVESIDAGYLEATSSKLYVLDSPDFYIYDITTPDSPTEITSENVRNWLPDPDNDRLTELAVKGEKAYIGYYKLYEKYSGGILVIDMSDPNNLKKGNYQFTAEGYNSVKFVAASGDYILASAWKHSDSPPYGGKIFVLNTVPNAIGSIENLPANFVPSKATYGGGYVYFGGEHGSHGNYVNTFFIVADNPEDPEIIKHLPGGQYFYQIIGY